MKRQAVLISIIFVLAVILTVLSWNERSLWFFVIAVVDIWMVFKIKTLIKKRREAKAFYFKVLKKYNEITNIRGHLNNAQYNQLYYNFADNPRGFLETEYIFIERCEIKYVRYKDFLKKREAQEMLNIFDKTEKQRIQEIG